MIPGANLFNVASRLIGMQKVQYMKNIGRVQDKSRNWISKFAAPVMLRASVQAVNRSKYQELGLELQKNYVNIFTTADIVDIERDASGDQFIFNHRLYQMESETSWTVQDGWASCLCVEIKKGV